MAYFITAIYIIIILIFLYRSFYSVLLGYCGYYAFFYMATSLPDSLETAESDFDNLLVTMATLLAVLYACSRRGPCDDLCIIIIILMIIIICVSI